MVGERGKQVMGIEEGTCWDEQWVLYVSDESWESIPETKSTLYTLYVSQLDNKLYFFKKSKAKTKTQTKTKTNGVGKTGQQHAKE